MKGAAGNSRGYTVVDESIPREVALPETGSWNTENPDDFHNNDYHQSVAVRDSFPQEIQSFANYHLHRRIAVAGYYPLTSVLGGSGKNPRVTRGVKHGWIVLEVSLGAKSAQDAVSSVNSGVLVGGSCWDAARSNGNVGIVPNQRTIPQQPGAAESLVCRN